MKRILNNMENSYGSRVILCLYFNTCFRTSDHLVLAFFWWGEIILMAGGNTQKISVQLQKIDNCRMKLTESFVILETKTVQFGLSLDSLLRKFFTKISALFI